MGYILLPEALESCHCRAEMHLTELTMINFETAETYYQLATNLSDGETCNFTLLNGTLTYTGLNGKFFFSGSSNCRVNKACRVTFELQVNDVLMNGCATPVDFTVLDKTKSFNCGQVIELHTNDVIKVKAVCDTNDVNFTLEAFSIVLWGR